MDKDDVVHTYSGLSHLKKENEIMPFGATWMNLEITVLSEISQKEKKKLQYDVTHMWNLKYDRNELPTKQKHIHRQTDLQLQSGMVEEGWIWTLGFAGANYYIQN